MKIRNNTNKKLVFYFGNPISEEPEFVKDLKIGEELELSGDEGDISIQEN